MFQYTADELFAIITGSAHDNDLKCQAITELKAHIKREFVDLAQVPRYFEALKVGNKSLDFKLSSVSFSSTCHLIKRVGMQDPNALRGPSKIILPILVNRLLDPKPLFQQQAKFALETYWLATPSIVEKYIKDNALIHSNPRIRAESIVFISDLIELNKNFKFSAFLPNVINLLRDDVIDVVKNADVLLLKYYTLHKSKISELTTELKSQKIDMKRAVKLLRDIDITEANAFAAEMRASVPSKPTIDTFSNLARTQKRTVSSLSSTSANAQRSSSSDPTDILAGVPTAKLDSSVRIIRVSCASDIYREVELLLPPFSGKETEFNWNNREKNIIKFRGLVIGNADRYPEELVAATRVILDGINKSTLSLRTTLSSNGCQLIKEIASYLTTYIDPIADNLFNPLATLSSATKKISSLNAFGSICVLLMNISYNSRLFHQCYNLFLDKNVQPRLYSSTFLRIFIQRHSSRLDNILMEIIVKWISKGISDQNTMVRESMRITFWLFYRKFTDVAETIISKQDMSVKKALERSRPNDISSANSAPITTNRPPVPSFERKRPTVRDFITAKKSEQRRSTSGPQLALPEKEAEECSFSADLGKPARIGIPQRVRVSSAGETRPLEIQLSKGRTEEKIKWVTPASRDNTLEISKTSASVASVPDSETFEPVDEELELIMKRLKSPLTRERVEGIESLKSRLLDKKPTPMLTPVLNNLVILDVLLLKPLLDSLEFFDLIDISLSVKVLAVNKMDISVLVDKFGNVEVTRTIVSLIKSLDTLQFDNAPSTMFHIKYKSIFLDYSVQNLYRITSSDDCHFESYLVENICSAVFPLSISDYPRYDELIVQLHRLYTKTFQLALSSSNAYVQSKVGMILDDFKEDLEDNLIENTIPVELTMINPFNSKTIANLKTESLVIPLECGEEKEAESDVDYMSDIFSGKNSKEPTRDFTFVGPGIQKIMETNDHKMNTDSSQADEDEFVKDELPALISLDNSNVGSPFLSDPNDYDDDIEKRIEADDATHTMTVNLNEIHISPEKFEPVPLEKFNAPDRNSLSDIITKSDPIFNKTVNRIQIFEDAISPVLLREKKLFDLELALVQNMDDEDTTISGMLELVDRLNQDKVDRKTMNTLIKVLEQAVNKDEITSWMKEGGFRLLLTGVFHYFHSSVNITKELCYKGLIVLKELLIVNEFLKFIMMSDESKQVWDILVMVVENLKDFKNSIFISCDELADDLIGLDCVDIQLDILRSCCNYLQKDSNSVVMTSFLLATLSKCMKSEDMVSLSVIKEIDSTIFKFLSDDEVEVRRLTIIAYSKCKRTLQQLNSNEQPGNDKFKFEIHRDDAEDTFKDVFDKLSLPQRKLVDYYCDN